MTELRTKTALLFSPEANEPWFWQRQNRRRNWKVQRSQPELFRCDEYIQGLRSCCDDQQK
jgi:hypothetical protein